MDTMFKTACAEQAGFAKVKTYRVEDILRLGRRLCKASHVEMKRVHSKGKQMAHVTIFVFIKGYFCYIRNE